MSNVPEAGGPPNEKLIETLFNRFALAAFPPGRAWIFTPTTWQEHRDGYDTALTGEGGRELLLQFKRPHIAVAGWASFPPTDHQHKRLKLYPRFSAFYVVPLLRTLVDIQKAQRTPTEPLGFLRNYLAIEISSLPDDLRIVRYGWEPEMWAMYRRQADGQRATPTHEITKGFRLRGDQLVTGFQEARLGSRIGPSGLSAITEEDDHFKCEFVDPVRDFLPFLQLVSEEVTGPVGNITLLRTK